MSETQVEAPPSVRLTPRERVAKWEPFLREHGWSLRIVHTDQRARLEAMHRSGAVVMVTSGSAGRTSSGHTKFYVLKPGDGPVAIWLGVRRTGFEEFVRSRVVSGYWNRVESKCQCRTGAGRRKVRYATKSRAKMAMADARRQRERDDEEETAECRTYRCPDDDRVWHMSSRRSWRKAAGESALWDGS